MTRGIPGAAQRLVLAGLALCAAHEALADSRFFAALPGQRVNDALSGLEERGYRHVGTEDEHGQTLYYVWSSQNQDCEVVAARDGRVVDVQSVSPGACRGMSGSGDAYDRHGRDPGYAQGPLPREITGLVGNKRDDAERKLGALGFEKLDGRKSDGSTSGLWWSRSRGECLSVEARDGKVRSIERVSRSSCD
jgi:hypothetical protein